MGPRPLDDLAIGVDQGVGLARQRRDFDGKLTLEPFGAAGADIGDRVRNSFQRREAEADLEDRRQQQHDSQGGDLTAAGVRLGYVDGPEGQTLRMVERPVDLGADGKFLVSVAGDATEIFDETRSFDYYLGGTFAALGIVLLLTTIFQVRFGLAPLKRISDSIADIRSGRAERLEGEFPVEIAPLARETNALIDANREIVERARTHVGNLAHAIKTPLSEIGRAHV